MAPSGKAAPAAAWLSTQEQTHFAVNQKLSDKSLAQENSLTQLINVLILLCQVAKAEEMQFNSSSHAGTPKVLFQIPPSSPILFMINTWFGAGLRHHN